MNTKPTILVVVDWFLPGYKGGGSLRTVVNVIDRLSDEFEFRVMTHDRDWGDRAPFPNLAPGWNRLTACQALYLSPRSIHPLGIWRALRATRFDLLYLNSFFSTLTVCMLLLRRVGLFERCAVVLAPRGEMAPNALRMKALKKSLYLFFVRRLGLVRGITWLASSEIERGEIHASFDAEVLITPDVADNAPVISGGAPPSKRPGSAHFVFLSRLDRKKNLGFAIELLGELEGDIEFDIYGAAVDSEYLEECRAQIARLPNRVRCSLRGPIPHDQVIDTLSGYHFFLLPTLNENYGHVMLESLSAGVPLVVSQETPWRGLEDLGVGFDLPLADRAEWQTRLQHLVDLDAEEHQNMSAAARRLAADSVADESPVKKTRSAFNTALHRGAAGGTS